MKLKFLIDEDQVNYKEWSMFIGFPYCSFKCDKDNGNQYCQNYYLKDEPVLDIPVEIICERYLTNPITHALVLGGLEPLDSPMEVTELIDSLRHKYECNDTIVIYTGYTEEELNGNPDKEYDNINFDKLHAVYKQLQQYENIIVKFGRYIPGDEPHPDELLGISLASDNQYAKFVGKPVASQALEE